MPIVATNVGGIPNMLTNNESALLTNVDAQEIANAFERLSNDVNLREKLGKAAQKESFKFSSNTMAKKYMEIYENSCE